MGLRKSHESHLTGSTGAGSVVPLPSPAPGTRQLELHLRYYRLSRRAGTTACGTAGDTAR
jgi:hypothetical protein